MSDDLARFPTPQEAFGLSRPHTSAAFERPTNVPPPPVQQRFRQHGDHQPPSSNHRPLRADGQRVASAGAYPTHSQSGMYGPPPSGPQGGAHAVPGGSNRAVSGHRTPHGTPYGTPQGTPQQGGMHFPPQMQKYSIPRRPVGSPSLDQHVHHSSSQTSLDRAANRPTSPVAASVPAPAPPPTRPMRTATDLRSLFDEVDRHKRGYLTERELSKALVNGDYTLFDAHTVRLMMKMFDRDGDGAVYFAEFGQLWRYLHDWRQVFERFDTSDNDSISLDEFIRALAAFGYNLSSTCLLFLFNAGSKLNRQGQREMSFDMFVQSCISIKSITDTFKKYDTDRDGFVTMGFEDFLMETTKLH